MTISSVRLTVLQTVNEVRRRRGLQTVSTLGADSQSTAAVDILNGIIAEISDFGDWNETLVTANVTTQSSVANYAISIPASAGEIMGIKTIKDIFFEATATPNGVPLMFVSQEDMRMFGRVFSPGEPRQYTVFGTDAFGNPMLRVNPVPTSAAGLGVLSVRAHVQPPLYTTADNSVVIPFNSRLVVQGLLAACILDEEGGSPTDHYTREYSLYQEMMRESYNRFKADVGRWRRFVPGSRRFRRNVR
jgi:hypothetical protein